MLLVTNIHPLVVDFLPRFCSGNFIRNTARVRSNLYVKIAELLFVPLLLSLSSSEVIVLDQESVRNIVHFDIIQLWL